MSPRSTTLQTDDNEAGLFLAEQVRIANLHWDGFAQAVLNIATNWDHGHQLGRLHAGLSAAEFISANIALKDRRIIVPLLTESNLSHRGIAQVAGVSHQTVGRVAKRLRSGPNGPREADDEREVEVGPDQPDEVWVERRLRAAHRAAVAFRALAANWDEGRCVGRFYAGRTALEVFTEKMPDVLNPVEVDEVESWAA